MELENINLSGKKLSFQILLDSIIEFDFIIYRWNREE